MQISKTKINRPPIILSYGDHKIGKSTFAAGMPNAVFLPTEDGLQNISVEAFPLATSWKEFQEYLQQFKTEKHGFKTLVIDSLDWLEKLIWKDICEAEGWKQIGDGPYGAGYKLALNYWRDLIATLTEINAKQKVMICLIAHAKITKFEDPQRASYDRYDLDLHDKTANYICQFADIIAFADTKIIVKEKQEGLKKTAKAVDTQERVLRLSKAAAYEAGNRYGLPDEIPMSWDVLATELKATMVSKPEGNLAKQAEDKKKRDAKKQETADLASRENHPN